MTSPRAGRRRRGGWRLAFASVCPIPPGSHPSPAVSRKNPASQGANEYGAILLRKQRQASDEGHYLHSRAVDVRGGGRRRGLRDRADRLRAARSGRRRSPSPCTGEVAGSVTGGCVEPAVIREATEVLNGSPGRICRYGLSRRRGLRRRAHLRRLDRRRRLPARPGARRPDRRGGRERHVGRDDGPARRGALRRAAARPRRQPARRPSSSRRAVAARARRERDRRDGRRRARVRRVVRAAARPVHLRRQRPRHRARDDGQVPRLPRHGLRRPHHLRHRASGSPTPTSSSIEWPDRFLETAPVDARTAICMMTHDLKFDVPALTKALGDERRLHRRDREREDAHRARRSACATRASARPSSPGCTRRSASSSAPGRPRRSRSRSPRRSSSRTSSPAPSGSRRSRAPTVSLLTPDGAGRVDSLLPR